LPTTTVALPAAAAAASHVLLLLLLLLLVLLLSLPLPRRSALLALLLFVNPLYFALILTGEMRAIASRRAVIGGCCAAPLVLFLPAGWALLAAGLLGGTLAFLWGERHGRR
jgi:hypothetical protein